MQALRALVRSLYFWLWIGTFTSVLITTVFLVFCLWLVTALGGGHPGPFVEFYSEWSGASLLIAAVLATAATLLGAVLRWVFKRDPPPPLSPTQRFGPTGSTTRHQRHAPVARPWYAALYPWHGLWFLLASAVLALGWLLRPVAWYAYWQWAEHGPLLAAVLLMVGGALAAWGYLRARDSLSGTGWRLRAVGSGVAVLLVWAALSGYRDDMQQCSEPDVQGMVKARNASGLKAYAHSHAVCREAAMRKALDQFMLSGALQIQSPGDAAMLEALVLSSPALSRWQWRYLIAPGYEDALGLVLKTLSQDPAGAGAFVPEAMAEHVKDWAAAGSSAMLDRFVASGLRLQGEAWRAHALWLVLAALDKPEPSWPVYDSLLRAGLPVSPELRALAQAIRAGSAEPVKAWVGAPWWAAADAQEAPTLPLIALAVMLTHDTALRAQFLALAGTDEAGLLARTALPGRCALAGRLGAAAVRGSLAALGEADPERVRCERNLALPEPRP